jgi:hypothetical protein
MSTAPIPRDDGPKEDNARPDRIARLLPFVHATVDPELHDYHATDGRVVDVLRRRPSPPPPRRAVVFVPSPPDRHVRPRRA